MQPMNNKNSKTGFFSRKILFGTSLGAAIFFIVIGILLWASFNWTLEASNTEAFCISCHEMRDNVYEEYKGTIHYSNRTGVRATCPDCHVPKQWQHKIIRKLQATSELYHKLLGTIDSPEKYEAKRHELAQHVWQGMQQTNSRECRNCHDFSQMNAGSQKPAAARQHALAQTQDKTCIDCHKGIAHTLSEKFMEIEHEQYLAEDADCSQCHADM
jgi:cytochrome c-type protein NapC